MPEFEQRLGVASHSSDAVPLEIEVAGILEQIQPLFVASYTLEQELPFVHVVSLKQCFAPWQLLALCDYYPLQAVAVGMKVYYTDEFWEAVQTNRERPSLQ